ncbi:MAG: hypothetical protein BGO95_03055 [Micrococcales bacterium 73-13]|nr:MAG: hypothetical protein BGO95_03055 [Micrococcales bacterium 73-13]
MSAPRPPGLRAIVSPDWSSDLPDADVAVLLLHGYGADERDLLGLVEPLRLAAPWASLRAPLALPGASGAAWFPIDQLDAVRVDPIESATAQIWAWVDAELPERTQVLPIGFSQGGLMATQLLRTRPDRVVAPVVLAGLVLAAPQPADSPLAAARPPAFWGRGDLDAVIPAHAVATAADFLATHTTLTERVYPGLGHQISMAELADVAGFIAAEAGEHVTHGA